MSIDWRLGTTLEKSMKKRSMHLDWDQLRVALEGELWQSEKEMVLRGSFMI